MNQTRAEVIQTIMELKELPTLPEVAQRVYAKAQDPNVGIRDLKKLILPDPPLSAKVMKLANSAAFARRNPAKTLEEALVTVGINNLVQICLSIGVFSSFDSWKEMHVDRKVLWRHAITTAFLSKSLELRKDMMRPNAPDMFLAGLLHNIGWIVFDHLHPDLLSAAIHTLEETEEWSLDIERELLGLDHAEAGGLFLRKWRLPESVTTVVENHHTPNLAGEMAPYAGLLQISAALVPNPFPLDVPIHEVSEHVPHLLKHQSGEDAIKEMQERYAAHIKQAGAIAELMVGWL